MITNTKKLKLKIYSRVWNFQNTMLKKRRKRKKKEKNRKRKKNMVTKIIKNIYMKFAFKKRGLVFAK